MCSVNSILLSSKDIITVLPSISNPNNSNVFFSSKWIKPVESIARTYFTSPQELELEGFHCFIHISYNVHTMTSQHTRQP